MLVQGANNPSQNSCRGRGVPYNLTQYATEGLLQVEKGKTHHRYGLDVTATSHDATLFVGKLDGFTNSLVEGTYAKYDSCDNQSLRKVSGLFFFRRDSLAWFSGYMASIQSNVSNQINVPNVHADTPTTFQYKSALGIE